MTAPPRQLTQPALHMVTDRRLCPLELLPRHVDRAIIGGVTAVHLREPGLPTDELYELGCDLMGVCGTRAMLVVHDRVDVAQAVGAPAVQLGEHSLSVAVSRRLIGAEALIGRSVHSLPAAVEAASAGADFLVLGTIFGSRSHPGDTTAGLALVEAVCARVDVPVLAIGGVTAANVAAVMAAGAYGVAAISSVLGAPDPELAARAMYCMLRSSMARRLKEAK